ncbi:MAG: glycerate kinase [Halodesulfurarchaeum sp.]|nr:glycerate kinase [Halodesulfurarchaeum sp.]
MKSVENRETLVRSPDHETVLDSLLAGIEASDPAQVIEAAVTVDGGTLRIDGEAYDLSEYDEVVVLGGGNAASQVARALEKKLGEYLDGGIVVTDDPVETERVTVLPGDHPVPSELGVESTRQLLDRARETDADTLVLGVITGGGSALMAAPAFGIELEELIETTDQLLRSGAPIQDINAVRKHLSALKGGQLAALAAPATTVSLVLSDVVGNHLDVIASGPFVPDPTTFADARAVIERFDLSLPDSIEDRIESGVAGDLEETPKPGDPVFDRVTTHIVADGMTALEAAADVISDAGYEPLVLSSRVEGEASEAAKTHAAIANEIRATGTPIDPPAAILTGGETTVTVDGGGSGGPNQEFALSAGLAIEGSTIVGAVDSDGIDGASDAAGALVDESAIDRPAAQAALDANDSGAYLAEQDRLIVTGQTGTNVNDIRVLLVPEPT